MAEIQNPYFSDHTGPEIDESVRTAKGVQQRIAEAVAPKADKTALTAEETRAKAAEQNLETTKASKTELEAESARAQEAEQANATEIAKKAAKTELDKTNEELATLGSEINGVKKTNSVKVPTSNTFTTDIFVNAGETYHYKNDGDKLYVVILNGKNPIPVSLGPNDEGDVTFTESGYIVLYSSTLTQSSNVSLLLTQNGRLKILEDKAVKTEANLTLQEKSLKTLNENLYGKSITKTNSIKIPNSNTFQTDLYVKVGESYHYKNDGDHIYIILVNGVDILNRSVDPNEEGEITFTEEGYVKLYSSSLMQSTNVSLTLTQKTSEGDIDRLEKKIDTIGSAINIILPKYACAAVNQEFNIYLENVVVCDDANRYQWVWDMRPYNGIVYDAYKERFCMTPPTSKTGTYTLKLTCLDKTSQKELASASMEIYVVPIANLNGKKVMFIGDSLTSCGHYEKELVKSLSADKLVSIGTLEPESTYYNMVKNEGRGGWSAYDYCHTSSHNGYTNAFLFNGAFNFSQYMSANSFSGVDVVFINIGTNANARNVGATIEDKIANEIASIKTMITSIRAYNANVPICLHLVPPPSNQDGYTSKASHGSNVEIFRKYTLDLNARLIEEFGTINNKVYLTPIYFCIDRLYDFNPVEKEVSARNTNFKKLVPTDGIHPYGVGMLKMADMYWGTLNKALG